MTSERLLRAAAEFAVIVIGVLTALAVDQWRESAEEHALRDEYLAGLAEDIGDELTYLDYVADLSRARVRAADRILLFLGHPAGASDSTLGYVAPTGFDPDSVVWDLSEAASMQFFVPEAVVWEDLMATGNLRLIDDPDVRRRVSRYYTQIRYQTRDLDQLHDRFAALATYLLARGVSLNPAARPGSGTALTSFPELHAYIRGARDTQAEVLARTIELREDAEGAYGSVVLERN